MDLRTLAQPSSRFAGDHGEPDPVTRAAIAKAVDQPGYIRALVALCTFLIHMFLGIPWWGFLMQHGMLQS